PGGGVLVVTTFTVPPSYSHVNQNFECARLVAGGTDAVRLRGRRGCTARSRPGPPRAVPRGSRAQPSVLSRGPASTARRAIGLVLGRGARRPADVFAPVR